MECPAVYYVGNSWAHLGSALWCVRTAKRWVGMASLLQLTQQLRKRRISWTVISSFLLPCRICVPSVVHSVAVGHVLCGCARSAENSEKWVLYLKTFLNENEKPVTHIFSGVEEVRCLVLQGFSKALPAVTYAIIKSKRDRYPECSWTPGAPPLWGQGGSDPTSTRYMAKICIFSC